MNSDKICPTCGRLHPLEARYCSNCGQLLRERFVSEEDTVIGQSRLRLHPADSDDTIIQPRPRVLFDEQAEHQQRQQARERERRETRHSSNSTAGAAVARTTAASSTNTSDPTTCALLSFFFPGVGQILAKQVSKGILLIVLAYIAVRYFHLGPFTMLMVVGRVLAAVDAYHVARRVRAGRKVEEWEWGLQNGPNK